MSYDVDLVIDTGGSQPRAIGYGVNHTYNTWNIIEDAMPGGINALNGKLAGECIPALELCQEILTLEGNQDRYLAMQPKNGWGTLESTVRFIREILEMCHENPKCTIRVS